MPETPTFYAWLQAWLPLIKDSVTTLAAGIAGIVAILGLRTWKKQLRGKTEYELAQRLAKTVYNVRDAIAVFRKARTIGTLLRSGMKEPPEHKRGTKQTWADATFAEYLPHWQAVQATVRDLDTVSLEAEAIWGHTVKKNLEPLQNCVDLLGVVLIAYIDQLPGDIHIDKPPSGFNQKQIREKVMFVLPGDKDNFFTESITAAVRQIEIFLKPYLKI